jgi:hypothetical protein
MVQYYGSGVLTDKFWAIIVTPTVDDQHDRQPSSVLRQVIVVVEAASVSDLYFEQITF